MRVLKRGAALPRTIRFRALVEKEQSTEDGIWKPAMKGDRFHEHV